MSVSACGLKLLALDTRSWGHVTETLTELTWLKLCFSPFSFPSTTYSHIYTGSNLFRKISAADIMRILSLLSSVVLLASAALAVEIVCKFVLNVFIVLFLLTMTSHICSRWWGVSRFARRGTRARSDCVIPRKQPLWSYVSCANSSSLHMKWNTDRCSKWRKK